MVGRDDRGRLAGMINHEVLTTLRTTGAARDFTDQPVDDDTVWAILDDARFAPSGGNRQGWKVVVVKDAAARRQMAAAMQPVWNEYVALSQTGITPFTVVAPAGYTLERGGTGAPAGNIPNPLLHGIADVPVMLVIAGDLGRIAVMDKDLDRMPMAGGASVFPFCWSILLSARARGLGGVLTTFMSRVEPEVAPLLGLPLDHALVATIYLGYPVHQPTKLKRNPVSSFATIDRFDGPPLADPS